MTSIFAALHNAGSAQQEVERGDAVEQSALERSIVQAVAYADVFDYPLTAAEIYRYLVGVAAPPNVVHALLHSGQLVNRHLRSRDGYFILTGREPIIETRQRRMAVAARLWPRALHYGRVIAALPFVRMVAITGALAVDNVEADADIDYLIVTEPGRLWMCRVCVIALVRLAARRGEIICPNYFLSERALILNERTLYTAHELLQMVPIAGMQAYRRMRRLNTWANSFLPNAAGPPRRLRPSRRYARPAQFLAEAALRTPIGGWFERWEMERKIRKFTWQSSSNTETAFCADWCKGHFDGHGQRALTAYTDRLRALDGVLA